MITPEAIYGCFEDDEDLLKHFDPASNARNNAEAAEEIYNKLVEHSRERDCKFVMNDIGYVFYSEKLLISFCVKPAFRDKENLSDFGKFIKLLLGEHFGCYLFNVNTRGIRFLERIGMKRQDSNELITLLTI